MKINYILWFHVFVLVVCWKPRNKRQQVVWKVECQLGIVTDKDCPVDGAWGTWETWSECHGSCDSVGRRQRTRECNNPPPQNDGIPCDGVGEQVEACYLTNCRTEDFLKIIQGNEARMEAFHYLEAVPALMERCLQVECPYEAIEASLINDNSWQLNAESLWNSLQCVKHNLGCIVIGAWSPWGAWSSCGARCGPGLRWRLRRCNSPAPSAAEFICNGDPLQSEVCIGDQCALREIENRRSSSWGAWGPWSSCSERCGSGVRRRKRTCTSIHTTYSRNGLWRTNCIGQHDQIEICENKKCILDGNWSGWGSWSPCSQSCGAGRRTRTRSCTKPIPAGGGKPCAGIKSEIGSCHLKPCEVFMHNVAIFNGEGVIHFNFEKKRSRLFHFYIRFLPLSPHGTLVRRGDTSAYLVRLSLQNWRVCVEANGKTSSTCQLRVCSNSGLESAVWHTILIAVTTEEIIIRINNAIAPITGTFSCDPDFPDDVMNVYIGEMFHGEIQEIILNFIPLKLKNEHNYSRKQRNFYPNTAANVTYEQANMDEAFLLIDSDHYLRLPCFEDQNEWRIELTLKPKKDTGTILFLYNDQNHNGVVMLLQSMRLVLKVYLEQTQMETISTTEYWPDQWLDIVVMKKKDSRTIEAIVNSEERLLLAVDNNQYIKKKRKNDNNVKMTSTDKGASISSLMIFCNNQMFIGGVPFDVTNTLAKDTFSLSFLLASLNINNVLQDLHVNNLERTKDNKTQISSRTASISGAYYELTWGRTKKINLTCIHNLKMSLPTSSAQWFYLDVAIEDEVKKQSILSKNDGRVLRLAALADKDLRGFYTCRVHGKRHVRNLITYGVVGEAKQSLSEPGKITILAVITTLGLIIFTLSWLIIEGINDLRNGYGFFRDHHLTPEEEAEAVCSFIDNNVDLIGSKSQVRLSKARARRKGKQLAASYPNFGAQEPQGIMQVKKCIFNSSDVSDLEKLPALPTIKSSSADITHELYKRDEPWYVSSPQHGSDLSPKGNLTTSSPTIDTTPRHLCAQLLLTKKFKWSFKKTYETGKRFLKSNDDLTFDSDQKASRHRKIAKKRLLTIQSSFLKQDSPAMKILKKFNELKNEDD